MKRKLLRQICNEWKSNVWLGLELVIVSVVMWYVIDSLWCIYSTNNEPRGFNTDHCYLIEYDRLSDRSPDYRPYESRQEESDDFLRLFDRLGARPEVEAVACGMNAYIYNGSNSGTDLNIDTLTSSSAGFLLRRVVSPEFPIVFRIEGTRGETPEQLAEILRNNTNAMLCSDNLYYNYGIEHMDDFIGRRFANTAHNDSVTLAAAYKVVRYNDYTTQNSSRSMMETMPRKYYVYNANELMVRVKDNMDTNFKENLMRDATSDLRFGNFYISNVKSFEDIRANHQLTSATTTRNTYVVMVFLAINIFLGLLGTFWFRTRQRIHEIAIRMANGATSTDVFRRFIGEGELLLTIVTPLAVIVDGLLTYFEYNHYYGGYFAPGRFAACVLLTYALMTLMILLGTVIPAYRAMKLQPAAALKEE